MPQDLSASAPEMGLPGADTQGERLPAHVRQHQHVSGGGILYDGRHQTALTPINCRDGILRYRQRL